MITGHQVARAAGVSQSTVSRALRGSPAISPETTARVRAVAEQLGYVPSQYGRQLRTGRSHRVGVLATELDNPFYMALLDPIHSTLREHGYATVVLTEPANSPVAFADLVDGSFDGIVLTNCRTGSPLPTLLQDHGLAVATVNREVDVGGVDSCAAGNARGGELVAEALLAAGHRRIAAIEGPVNTSTGRDRSRGFRASLRRSGVRIAARRGEFTFTAGRDSFVDLMTGADPPTAVFCANDVIALGALNAAVELGLGVPDDVSLVGFDDIPMAAWPMFDLATVRCDLTTLGRTGADLVVRRIQHPRSEVRREVLEPEFIARGSLR